MKHLFFAAAALSIASYGTLLLDLPGRATAASLALEVAGYCGALGTFFAAGALLMRWAMR